MAKLSSFEELMALSAKNTTQAQHAAELALAQREEKLQRERKAQAERDRKMQEEEKRMRTRKLEEQKREEERLARKKAQEDAAAALLHRREETARHTLLYGPPKKSAAKASSSGSGGGSGEGTSRAPRSASPRAGEALTREELRARKQEAEQRRMFSSPKRAGFNGTKRAGKKLAGGAVDLPSQTVGSSGAGGIRDRILAMPNALTKLNTVKRDTRTIDEIANDLKKAKNPTLHGDSAKEFDFFSSSKKKDPAMSAASTPATRPGTPASNASSSQPVSSQTSAGKRPAAAPAATSRPSAGHPSKSVSKSTGSLRATASSSSSKPHKPSRLAAPEKHKAGQKKRSRSTSRSESPPPRKRRATSEDDYSGYRPGMIWDMLGRKPPDHYSRGDIFSDDESDDMEADASMLEREEQASARLAKREDEAASLAEKRHMEDKARRKKERDQLGRGRA